MATPNLALFHLQTNQDTKEVTFNAATDVLDAALTDSLTVVMTGGLSQILSKADALGHMVFSCTGTLTGGQALFVPHSKKLYIVKNNTSGGFAIQVQTYPLSGGSIVVIPANLGYVMVFCDGNNILQVTRGSLPTLTLLQLTDAPASYSGAGGYAVEVNAGATAVVFNPKLFDCGLFCQGSYSGSLVVFSVLMGRSITFKQNLPSSKAVLGVSANASTVFSIQKNGTQFATLTFAIAGTVGTFVCGADTTFAAGDILSVVAPASPDATAANLGIMFVGIRN